MIFQDPNHPNRVLGQLAGLLADPSVERLRVAVAYANPGGVALLQSLLSSTEREIPVEVVLTLDMGITRKGALEALLEDDRLLVRVISTGSGAGTFHAKAFVADRGEGSRRALIGSANLTTPALTRNHEAASVVDLAPEGTAEWEKWWGDLVAAAEDLTADVIEAYAERRPLPGRRERIADEEVKADGEGSVVTSEESRLSADAADWLLIDWGGTGEYRAQSELPKAPAAFFAPSLDEAREITLRYDGSAYADNSLAFYSDNGMVRINLDSHLPVVGDDSVRRQAALFTRLGPDCYELRLVDDAERAARLAEAVAVGGDGYTSRNDGTKRRFGWGGAS